MSDNMIKIINVDVYGDPHTFKPDNKLLNIALGGIRKMNKDFIYDLCLELFIEIVSAGHDGNVFDKCIFIFPILVQQGDSAYFKAPFQRSCQAFQQPWGRFRSGNDKHFVAAGAFAVYSYKELLQQEMPHIGEQNIVDKEIYEYKSGKILGQLGYVKKEAEDKDQYNIVFTDCDKFYIISAFEYIGVPVKKIVGQQMEKQDTGNNCGVGSGKGQVALLYAAGKNGQRKGENDTEAFYCQQGIILNKSLFLTKV